MRIFNQARGHETRLVRLALTALIGHAPLQAGAVASTGASTPPRVTATEGPDRVTILVDGELFTEYLTRSGTKPALWPVIGPTGDAMTRAYPLSDRRPHEQSDHIHHRSIWLGYEGVGGVDFWHEPEEGTERRAPLGEVAHREFVEVRSDANVATVVTRNDWLGPGKRAICSDRRTLLFGADHDSRWIDYRVELRASERALTIGDSKEGVLAVRVAGTMKVDAGMGGRIRNSTGLEDKQAWGMPAEWVDYSGPVGAGLAGVTIFSHPESFRHPCRWHVRTYGLFAANPFGEQPFPPADVEQGPVTLEEGETLVLRYKILLHRGELGFDALQRESVRYAGE